MSVANVLFHVLVGLVFFVFQPYMRNFVPVQVTQVEIKDLLNWFLSIRVLQETIFCTKRARFSSIRTFQAKKPKLNQYVSNNPFNKYRLNSS